MTNEQMEAKIQKLTLPLETQIMMSCDTQEDAVLLAVAMLRKVICIFDIHYQQEGRKALIEIYNKQDILVCGKLSSMSLDGLNTLEASSSF